MTAPSSERLRLFVAVELEEEARAAFAGLQQELRARRLENLRWVRPEGIHLTLKFLGETSAELVPAIRGALTGSVRGVPPHRLSFGALGTFGSRRDPRVLWVDLEGDVQTLLRLQGQVEQALAGAGFRRESRPFSPHLTLARVRPESARALAPRIEEAIQRMPRVKQEIPVREVSLMLSRLGPGGAIYRRLDVFALG